jgi:uncharacterized protein
MFPALMPILLALAAWLSSGSGYAAELERQWVIIGGEQFRVEVARTVDEQARGLMRRHSLAPDAGMLFVYEEPQWLAFWMFDTHIALDILYFDARQRLVNLHQDVPPCRSRPCAVYPSDAPAQYVLELNAGTAARLGVQVGDRLQIRSSADRSR